MNQRDLRAHLRTAVISNFAINIAINAALALWLLGDAGPLLAWGEPAYGPVLLITGFLLCALVSGIVMETSRRRAMRGELEVVGDEWPALSAASSHSRMGLCALAGIAGLLASAVVAVVFASFVTSLSVPVYAGVKGLWAGVLAGLVVVPASVVGALRGARPDAVVSR